MSTQYLDNAGITFAVVMMITFTALYVAAIWWLSRQSTKEAFVHGKIT